MPSDLIVSTHSRPKAAGSLHLHPQLPPLVSTHSRPKAAGKRRRKPGRRKLFQHTAARRRLARTNPRHPADHLVSTHSRPKAAGPSHAAKPTLPHGFNTQPPEGGWFSLTFLFSQLIVSTHSRPKAAGSIGLPCAVHGKSFNTQPPEGGWRCVAPHDR